MADTKEETATRRTAARTDEAAAGTVDEVTVVTTAEHYDKVSRTTRQISEVFKTDRVDATRREEAGLVKILTAAQTAEADAKKFGPTGVRERADLLQPHLEVKGADIYDPNAGVNADLNPKAADSTKRALAGEHVTTDEPMTSASPEIVGRADHTPVGNLARSTNTELAPGAPEMSARNEDVSPPRGGTMTTSTDPALTGTAGDPGATTDYESMTKEELQQEASRRNLTVTGTGADGNVLKSDLVSALSGQK